MAPTGIRDAYQISHRQSGSPTAVKLNDRADSFYPVINCNIYKLVATHGLEGLPSVCGALSALYHTFLGLRDFWDVTQTLDGSTTQQIQTSSNMSLPSALHTAQSQRIRDFLLSDIAKWTNTRQANTRCKQAGWPHVVP